MAEEEKDMTLYDKMLVRLYAGPTLLLVGTVAVEFLLGAVAKKFAASPGFIAAIPQLSTASHVAAMLLLGFAFAWTARNTWRLWAWHRGNGGAPCCDACGGLADVRKGQDGRYRKCLACGKASGI